MGKFSSYFPNEMILKYIWLHIQNIRPKKDLHEILSTLHHCNQAWRVLVDGSEKYADCRLCLYEEQYYVKMMKREREERWVKLYDYDASDQ